MKSGARFRSSERRRAQGGWRVAVVDTADDLNANAANALLKILEEPPPRTLFLVLAHAPKMLATIRSRCQKLAVRPLSDNEIVEALTRWALPMALMRPTRSPLAAQLAGRLGAARHHARQ